MKKQSYGLFSVFFLLAIMTISSNSYACSSSYCMVPNMPHYNQNGDGVYSYWHLGEGITTNLCVPTSTSMMTMTMINNHSSDMRYGKSLDVVNFTSKTWMDLGDFKNGSVKSKVHNMAKVLRTTKDGGTGGSSTREYLNDADHFFKNRYVILPGGRHHQGTNKDVNVSDIAHHIRNHGYPAAGYFNYGHYRKNDVNIFGINFRMIERKGGHAMAIRGYWSDYLYIYDPWYAAKWWTKLKKVHNGWDANGNYVILPGGYTRVSVAEKKFNDGSYWPIMDRYGSFGKRNY